jgi:hypothetical protein
MAVVINLVTMLHCNINITLHYVCMYLVYETRTQPWQPIFVTTKIFIQVVDGRLHGFLWWYICCDIAVKSSWLFWLCGCWIEIICHCSFFYLLFCWCTCLYLLYLYVHVLVWIFMNIYIYVYVYLQLGYCRVADAIFSEYNI